LHALLGKAAIANAKAAHAKRGKLHATPSWQELAGKGACPQRLLWASTGTKDPKYSDVLYVEELAGPDTVNTMPMKTLDAFRDHGAVADRLNQAQDQAQNVLRSLAEEGISLNDITDELLRDGIAKFTNSFDKLLAAVQGKLAFARHHLPPNQPDAVFQVGPLSARLPRATLAKPIRDALVTLDRWTLRRNVARLWAKDGALWTGGDESAWMGWLDAAHQPLQQGGQDLTKTPWQNTYKHVVLLGMGGSSLAPEVLAHVYGDTELKPSTRIHGDCGDGRTSDHRGDNGKVARLIQTGHPAIPSIPLICGTSLHVLDTTDPAQIGQLREQLPLEDTLFIVSSKSGTTLETELLRDFFWHETRQKLGEEQAGSHFIAVTDPGTPLEQFAQAKGFACVFQGEPSIGGRYSALSPFGLVPALALGIPLQPLAEQAKAMADACAYSVAPADNPAVLLGILLGALARHGRNKVTFITDEKTKALGAWLEQLLAESTGKQKQGVIPIDGEELGETAHYGSDRVFVWLDSTASVPCHPERSDSDAKNLPTDRNAGRSFVLRTQDDKAGHPVIRLHVAPHEGIAQQFVLWEIATAVLGSVLGINPFDQPDVEASKQRTRTFMQDAEQTGRLSPLSWTKQENGLCVLIADAGDSGPPKDNSASVVEILRNHLAQLSSGDCFSPPSPLSDIQPSVKSHESESYFGLLAFLPRHDACVATLNRIRHRVHQTKRVATTAGFGPRFLHSIGQLYKGGPRQGVFVTITCDDQPDLPIPDRSYGFRAVKEAQARGDFAVVAERGQRILRIHMRGELDDGLRRLERVFTQALTLHKR
ncbi:MAG: transaldolase family protein, partial [Myxococcota bacterium]